MDAENVPIAIINAHMRLIALNFQSWKPDVENWFHSVEPVVSLQQLLAHFPCSPTLH